MSFATMKVYIGTKLVRAAPKAKEDGTQGYEVIYPDGYKSWSPKAVFEQAYRLVSEEERELVF